MRGGYMNAVKRSLNEENEDTINKAINGICMRRAHCPRCVSRAQAKYRPPRKFVTTLTLHLPANEKCRNCAIFIWAYIYGTYMFGE